MTFTLKHKIYALILAAGFGALAFDQFGGPVHAALESIAPGSTDVAADSSPATGGANAQWLSGRLQQMASINTPQRDAFAMPANWAAAKAGQAEPASAFATSHKLTAVVVSNQAAAAVINGTLVRVGQTIDGMKLAGVGAHTAHLEGATASIDLAMIQ